MIPITDDISIDQQELEWEFVRSSGPGGQNVNKVSTAVQLRFDVKHSSSLPAEVKERLKRLAGRRMTRKGHLIIEAHRFRYQERNREDALKRLKHLIAKAAQKPKTRKKTLPTPGSRLKRLETKRLRSEKKRLRQKVQYDI
jgi:ribosome-associated protein